MRFVLFSRYSSIREDRANLEPGGGRRQEGRRGGGWRLLPRTFLLTLGLNDDILMHRSPAGSAKGEQHLADDMATSETSLKYISSTGRKMEEELAPFFLALTARVGVLVYGWMKETLRCGWGRGGGGGEVSGY